MGALANGCDEQDRADLVSALPAACLRIRGRRDRRRLWGGRRTCGILSAERTLWRRCRDALAMFAWERGPRGADRQWITCPRVRPSRPVRCSPDETRRRAGDPILVLIHN